MPKSKPSVPILLTSPIRIVCPLCHAKSGRDCESSSGTLLPLVHVVRIKAAAKMDRRIVKDDGDSAGILANTSLGMPVGLESFPPAE